MSVRRIRAKQRSMKKLCDWCGEPATLRGFGWGKCACSAHEAELAEWDRHAQAPDYSDAQFYAGY